MKMLYGLKVFNWKNIMRIPPGERKAAIIDAAQKFLDKIQSTPPGVISGQSVAGQKIVGHDANLMPAAPIALIMSDTLKSPDRGYEALFDEVDMRASNNDTFEVLDVTGGVTFYQQVAGEEAKLSRLPKTAKASVGFCRFTGGFPILDDWLRFNKYYLIDQLFADTTRRWFDKKATLFYSLLAALSSSINQSYTTDDVTTINAACAAILEDLAAEGYIVDENSQFAITCAPSLRARIYKAIAASFVNPNTNNNQIVYNISTLISTTKLANTSYYVSLPGGKSQRGEWEDLNMRPPQRNELALGADHVWTGVYNGVIGEAKQYKRCALS
jgi:hypothetical protein